MIPAESCNCVDELAYHRVKATLIEVNVGLSVVGGGRMVERRMRMNDEVEARRAEWKVMLGAKAESEGAREAVGTGQWVLIRGQRIA